MNIKKNDQVKVISGRDKGKSGKVLKVLGKTGRVLVEKINLVKKHAKPTQKNPHGGFLDKELSIHYSNILLLCPKCNKGVRHGKKWIEVMSKKTKSMQKQKVRYCKHCGETLDTVS
ncbi:MAG: 50S ribosomal protein L24 [Deltaproteobacteria bacterium]|nr:50S ribosomal protein L24 [Deltaproteobacteria bacterium]